MLFILVMQLYSVGGNETFFFLPEDHRQALSLTIHILISIIHPFLKGGEGDRQTEHQRQQEREAEEKRKMKRRRKCEKESERQ